MNAICFSIYQIVNQCFITPKFGTDIDPISHRQFYVRAKMHTNSPIFIKKSFKKILLTLSPYLALGLYFVSSQAPWHLAFGFISLIIVTTFCLVRYLNHTNPIIIDPEGIRLGKTVKDTVKWIDIQAVSTASIMRGGRFVEIELKDGSKRKIAAEYLEISNTEMHNLLLSRLNTNVE